MLSLFGNRLGRGGEEDNDGAEYHRETEIKVILLGEASVGKTSLALRFTSDEFKPYAESTIGVSFSEPTMIYEEYLDYDDNDDTNNNNNNNNSSNEGTATSSTNNNQRQGRGRRRRRTKVYFKIWDTAGQEKYHALASMYYRGAAAAIVVYDVSRKSTFETLKKWVEELRLKGPPNIVILICGNKLDLEASGDRQVPKDIAQQYAREINALYIETSAKDSTNVREMFDAVSRKVPFVPIRPTTTTSGGVALGARAGASSAPIQLGAKIGLRHRLQNNCCR